MTALFDEMARKDLLSRFNERDFQYTGTPLSQLEVKEISSKTAREYIATFHYSKTYPDSTLYNYGAYLNGIIIGVVCYGMGCAKEQYINATPRI